MCRSTQECASTNSKIYSNQICMESRTIATAQCMESVESGQFGRDLVRGLSLHFGCTNLFVAIPRTATHAHTHTRFDILIATDPPPVLQSLRTFRCGAYTPTRRCTSTIEPKNMSEINKICHTMLVCQFNIKYCLCIFLNEAHLLHIIHILRACTCTVYTIPAMWCIWVRACNVFFFYLPNCFIFVFGLFGFGCTSFPFPVALYLCINPSFLAIDQTLVVSVKTVE